MRRFRLAGKIYEVASMDSITLLDMLQFEQETDAAGRRMSWGDIQEIVFRLEALPNDDERSRDPDSLWLMAATIWATRRAAGERVTFEDAINFPVKDLEMLPEPQDHKEASSPNARARTASGPGARKRNATVQDASNSRSQRTSSEASTSG